MFFEWECANYTQLGDALFGVTTGVLRGCGLQKIGAIVNLIAFYLIGVPLGALLAFAADLEIVGLWIGTVCPQQD